LFAETVPTGALRIYAGMVSGTPTSNGSRSKTIRMLGYMDVMGVVVRNKKIDWARRAVELVECEDEWGLPVVFRRDAVKLLRAHHQKVKRMVQNLKAAKHGLSAHTLDEVLDKLKELEG